MQTETIMDMDEQEIFEAIEHRDGEGWFLLLIDESGEAFDEIGPFETRDEAEIAMDLMDFKEAA
jgi:hypothetical protein